jgi:hypothetical protein
MNIGFYINSTEGDSFTAICQEVHRTLSEQKEYKDAAIFYEDIRPINHPVPCSLQNDAELWSFNGSLITPSLHLILKSNNVVNNINLYYYAGLENINCLFLLTMMNSTNMKIICASQEHYDFIKRITYTEPLGVVPAYKGITSVIK